jgi:hypothetical protein
VQSHDKAALLNETVKELISTMGARAVERAPQEVPVATGAAFAEALRHADEHRDLYRLVLSGEGGAAARAEIIAAFRATGTEILSGLAQLNGSEPRLPMALVTAAVAGALASTIEAWLAGELTGDAEELAAQFLLDQYSELGWVLGLPPAEPAFDLPPD